MDAIEQLKQDVRDGRIDLDRLIDVIVTQQRQLQAAKQRIVSALHGSLVGDLPQRLLRAKGCKAEHGGTRTESGGA